MPNHIVEILPKSIKVERNGRIDNSVPISAGLIVSCIRPNELHELIVGEVQNIALRGTQAFSDFPLDNAEDLLRNQLIKTKFVGRSVIKAEILVSLEASVINHVFSTLFEATTKLAQIGDPFASALLGLAGKGIQDVVKSNRIVSIGQGIISIDGDNLPDTVEITLHVRDELYSIDEHDDFDLVGDELEAREHLLNKGSENGSVVLSLHAL